MERIPAIHEEIREADRGGGLTARASRPRSHALPRRKRFQAAAADRRQGADSQRLTPPLPRSPMSRHRMPGFSASKAMKQSRTWARTPYETVSQACERRNRQTSMISEVDHF